MARRLRQLDRAAALALLAVLMALAPFFQALDAAPTPSPSPATPAPAGTPVTPPPVPAPSPAAQPSAGAKPKPPKPPKVDEWAEARRLFEQLSQDQQKKFLDNLEQWKSMPPEEQQLLRDRYLVQHVKIAQEIQDAINKSGLHLDDDRREVYALRYTQERRKIEEALHTEEDKKRQAMVADMLIRLKAEFSGAPMPASSAKEAPVH